MGTVIKSSVSTLIDAKANNGLGHIFDFSGATVYGGNIRIGRRRGWTRVRDAKFFKAGRAIELYGDDDANDLGVVNFKVNNIETVQCDHAIYAEIRTHALLTIENSRFLRSNAEPIHMDAVGSVIRRCDFTAANGEAFIRYGGDTERSSHHSVKECRFGSEDSVASDDTEYQTPNYDIAIGPSAIRGGVLRFRDNEHMGREAAATEGALAAFKLDQRTRNVHVTGSYFSRRYQNALVDEVADNSGNLSNIWRENVEQNGVPQRFSAGGTGWTVS
jgi:hypothetical protein